MDIEDHILCCGCLTSGCKMILLLEYWKKQTFLQIISEISVLHTDMPVWLCWECDAQINSFMKFKQKVKTSYNLFNEYVKQNTKLSKVKSKPRLTTHTIYNINIDNLNETESALFQLIKPENVEKDTPEITIKEEYEPTLADTNSDDEKLIDLSFNKEKKVDNVRTKKKKRKKKAIELYKEIVLTKEELEEERRLAMSKDDFVIAMFKCERCILSFPNADDLKDHVRMKHESNASKFKCSVCECTFATEVTYKYHTNKHIRRYQCGKCSERYVSKRGVMKHYEMTHFHGPPMEIEIQNKCHENGGATGETEITEDDTTKQSLATFACDYCEKIFKWKTSLRKHMDQHRIERGQKRIPYCEVCRLTFTNTTNLQKHAKTSTKHQIELKLRKLKETLTEDSSNPEKHQQRIEQIKCSVNSAQKKFPCPQCDKKFLWRGNLLRHLHSHVARASGELVCKPCNRTFSSIATYKQHMEISKKHVSENDFKYMCSDCGKRFANKTRLKDHMNWDHLKNYTHKCDMCEKAFKSHTSLYLHKQAVHKKDSIEHLCDHCGRPFPNQGRLRCHMLALHSGQSAYKCATCGAKFSWLSCLSRHNKKMHPKTKC